MHARVATIKGGQDGLEAAIEQIRNFVIPQAKQLPGFLGGYWIFDRDSAGGLGITIFDSLESVEASADKANQIRQTTSRNAGIPLPTFEIYEVIGHAGKAGTHARVSVLQATPDKVEQGIEFFVNTVIPQAQETEGNAAVLGLVDRATGKTIGITFWDSADALRASEDFGDQTRQQGVQATGGSIASVSRFAVEEAVEITVPAKS